MTIALKILALILGLPSAVILLLSLVHGFDRELLWLDLALAMAVMLSAALFFRSHDVGARAPVLFSLAGALVLGAVGLAVGFGNPGLFGVHGNLAPLVGVFVTGPVGFVVGALIGVILGWISAVGRKVAE